MTPRAEEIANTILYMCENSKLRTMAGLHIDNIVDEVGDEDDVESVIDNFLIPMKYIMENAHAEGYYTITELGKNYLRQNTNSSNMSFGNNTNIAYNSPNAQQSINIDISIYPQDVQDKIQELQDAVRDNDKLKFTTALGYILDKGVDIAIAIALAQLGIIND